MTLREFDAELKECGRGKFCVTLSGAIRTTTNYKMLCPIVYLANKRSKQRFTNLEVSAAAEQLGLSKRAVSTILGAVDTFRKPKYRTKLKRMLEIKERDIEEWP